MRGKEEELLEEISGYLHGYLKAGKVRVNSFLSKMNVNIANLEQLLTIRFLLQGQTMTFVNDLPALLTRFKTTTTMQNETYVGEVRGQINWPETIKERLAQNYKDNTIFSTNENVRSYNTPENLVLKELLHLLYTILYKDRYIKGFENAEWFLDWQQLKVNVKHAIQNNIYLQRVKSAPIPDRIILKTLRHRNRLYRDAARLLFSYRKLTRGDYSEEDLQTLLRETFIVPDNVDVLFELYWIIQLMKQNTDESQLHLLDGSQNLVASWEKNDHLYRLYHDSTGSGDIQFRISLSEIAGTNDPYLRQTYQSISKAKELAQTFFNHKTTDFVWRGRPDFLLEVHCKRTSKLVNVFIGEVKHTNRVDYALTGLEELLDYIHFVKNRKGEYLLGSAVRVEGLLCLDNVPIHETGVSRMVRVVKKGQHEQMQVECFSNAL